MAVEGGPPEMISSSGTACLAQSVSGHSSRHCAGAAADCVPETIPDYEPKHRLAHLAPPFCG